MKLPGLTSFMNTPVEQVEASQYNGAAARTAPQPSEPAHWRQWWEAGKQVLPIYIAVRVAALIVTCLAVLFTLHDFQWDSQPLSTLWHSWNRWDTIHFTTIATQGYADINNTAFFPLYSLLIRGTMFLGFSPLMAGLLISNAAGLLALIVLYQLVREDFDHEHAWRTVLYISLFPTAFFLIAAYNETLFLCLSLLSFYAMRHGRWWLAGLFGLLACLTRSAGLFLLIPFGYEYLRQRQFQLMKLRIDSTSAVLIPAGIGIFALYCYLISGDALAFSHVQAHWQRHLALPWHGILSSIYFIRHSSGLLSFYALRNLLDVLPGLFILLLIVLFFVGPWRLSRPYWAYGLYAAALFFFIQLVPAGDITKFPLQSTPRFMLEIFPAFLMLAILGKSRIVHLYYLLIAGSTGFFLLTQFLTGHWIV